MQGLRDVLVPETMDVVFDENNGALVVVRGALHIQVTYLMTEAEGGTHTTH